MPIRWINDNMHLPCLSCSSLHRVLLCSACSGVSSFIHVFLQFSTGPVCGRCPTPPDLDRGLALSAPSHAAAWRPAAADCCHRDPPPPGPATPCHLRLAPPGAATNQHLPPPPGTALAALASDTRPPLAAPTARRNRSDAHTADVVHLVAMDSSGCPIWIDPGNAFRLVVKVSKYVADGEYGNVEMTDQEHDLWFDRTELFTLEKSHDEMATKII
nr:unnamed protein product [Digitaria exilis]